MQLDKMRYELWSIGLKSMLYGLLFVTFHQIVGVSHCPAAEEDASVTQSLKVHMLANLNAATVPFLKPIILTAVVQNNSDVPIHVASQRTILDCEVVVLDTYERQVPLTRHGQSLKRSLARRGTTIHTIPPGGNRVFEVPVNLVYDMSVAGDYTIKARLRVLADVTGEGQMLNLESDSLTVSVGRRSGWIPSDIRKIRGDEHEEGVRISPKVQIETGVE